jgi:hypothetical protein
MVKPPKDKIERHYFEKFRQVHQLPDGSVVFGDKPDVIIHGSRKIGIEMTNFFLKSGSHLDSEQRQKPLRGAILKEARKLYRAGDGRNDINLTICFDKSNPVSPARRKKLPRELADLARSVENEKSGGIASKLSRDKFPEILSVWLHSKEEVDARWRLIGARSPRLMVKTDLEAKVREKEAKSGEYEQCDAHWLLIVVDGMDAAQDQEIRIDDPHVDSHLFERIIVFEPLLGHVVEVK